VGLVNYTPVRFLRAHDSGPTSIGSSEDHPRIILNYPFVFRPAEAIFTESLPRGSNPPTEPCKGRRARSGGKWLSQNSPFHQGFGPRNETNYVPESKIESPKGQPRTGPVTPPSPLLLHDGQPRRGCYAAGSPRRHDNQHRPGPNLYRLTDGAGAVSSLVLGGHPLTSWVPRGAKAAGPSSFLNCAPPPPPPPPPRGVLIGPPDHGAAARHRPIAEGNATVFDGLAPGNGWECVPRISLAGTGERASRFTSKSGPPRLGRPFRPYFGGPAACSSLVPLPCPAPARGPPGAGWPPSPAAAPPRSANRHAGVCRACASRLDLR